MPLGWSSASFLFSTWVTDTKVSGGHSWECCSFRDVFWSYREEATQNQFSLGFAEVRQYN